MATLRTAAALAVSILLGGGAAQADPGERKESFVEGGCKVEREWKKDGEYKEKRDCAAQGRSLVPGGEREEKYRVGDCIIEREWKEDGAYKESIECESGPPRRADAPAPWPEQWQLPR